MLGTNDCTYSEHDRTDGGPTDKSLYTPEAFRGNMEDIIQIVSENTGIVLSTIPEIENPEYSCDTDAYNQIIRDLAAEYDLVLRDLNEAYVDGNLPLEDDDLHLTAEANEYINDMMDTLCGGIEKAEEEEEGGGEEGGGPTGGGSSEEGISGGKVGPTGATEDDYCDILGIEFGVNTQASVDSMNDNANTKYFKYELGVVTYVVHTNNLGADIHTGNIGEVTSRTNAKRHVIRLVNDTGVDADQTAQAIEKIVEMFPDEIGSTVFVMPANEPLTELTPVRGSEPDGATAGGIDADWMTRIVNYLHTSSNSAAQDTSSYLIFPSFNMHDGSSNKISYINSFLSSYKGDLNGDFNSFGISTQLGGGRGDFTSVIADFRNILEDHGVQEGYKIDLFGASSINDESYSGWAEALEQAIKDHIDVMVGAHIFMPWGWDFDPTGAIRNYPIPESEWDKLFEDCQEDSQYACITTNLKDVPGIENCNEPESSGVNGDVIIKTGADGSRFAMPIITQQVEMTLLGWMGNNNNIEQTNDPNYEGPVYGTSVNQFMAPCAADKVTNEGVDLLLSKQFSGPIRMYYDEEDDDDAFDYQISLLVNAMACMIYDFDFTPGSLSMTELEPRFEIDAGEEIDVNDVGAGFQYESVETLKNSVDNIKAWITQMASKIKDSDNACSEDIYTRVEPTDAVLGAELVVQEMYMDFTDDYVLCAAIQEGSVYVDIPYYEYNPEGAFTQFCKPGGDTGYEYVGPDLLRYRALKGGVKRSEVLGGSEAMAQLWLDEAKANPWDGTYSIQHNDKAAVKATFSQRMYDYNSNDETDYTDPMTTVGDESCSLDVFDRESEKDLMDTGNSEFIYPFIGQSLSIMKRLHKIFNIMKDEGGFVKTEETQKYLEYRADEMQTFKDTAGEDDLIPSEMYGEILRALLNPNYIYTCEDIDDISKLSYNTDDDTRRKNPDDEYAENFADILTRIDCLMPNNDPTEKDPMQEWLCDNEYLESQYCIEDDYECIEPEVAEKLERQKNMLSNMKGKMSWPAEGRLTQDYFINKIVDGESVSHPGIDIANVRGTSIYAAAAGTVYFYREGMWDRYSSDMKTEKEYWDGIASKDGYPAHYGNVIVIEHEDYYTIYAHLDSILVKEGDVEQGARIGTMGSTGWSTSSHLHFEIRLKSGGNICWPYASAACTEDPEEYLEYPPGSEGDTDLEDWEMLPICPEVEEEPEAMEFDNMCRMLDYVEEETGACAQILAAMAYSESSATVQMEGVEQKYYTSPYDQSKVENNQACLQSIQNGYGCDCRGPLQFCTSFTPYEVTGTFGSLEAATDSSGEVILKDEECTGYNTWAYYGWPSDGQDATSLEVEPEKGQCVVNDTVMFTSKYETDVGNKGRMYDLTMDCVQSMGMDYTDGDYLDRTLFGPAICATAARFYEWNREEIAAEEDVCTEETMRVFAHAQFGPGITEENYPEEEYPEVWKALRYYQNKMVGLFNKFSDEEDWEDCVWFQND